MPLFVKRVLERVREQHGERFGKHRPQRIEQVLAVQRFTIELRRDRLHDFRMAVADVKNAEAAQTIDIFLTVDVAIRVGSRVGPLHGGRRILKRRRFAVLEESGVDVIAEAGERFPGDPCSVGRIDLRLIDQV